MVHHAPKDKRYGLATSYVASFVDFQATYNRQSSLPDIVDGNTEKTEG